MLLSALLFGFLVPCATTDDVNWRPLSEAENEELVKQCKDNAITSRVIGGHVAEEKVFPAAAVLVNYDGSPRCGATLISQRHLLTTRACFVNIKEMKHTSLIKDITLYAGSICQQSDGSNVCKDKGLSIAQKLKMDVMAFSSDPNRYAELAIIQLKDNITIGEHLRPICMRPPTENTVIAESDKVYMTGFGDPERKKKQKWSQLNVAMMQRATSSDEMYTLLTKEWCDSDVYYCFVPVGGNASATTGDAGSGVYATQTGDLVGINIAHMAYKTIGNLALRVDYFLGDICRLTGVCLDGVNATHNSPHINFDKILLL